MENDSAVYTMKKVGVGTGAPKSKMFIEGDLYAGLKTTTTNTIPTQAQTRTWTCSSNSGVGFNASDSTGQVSGTCTETNYSSAQIPISSNALLEITVFNFDGPRLVFYGPSGYAILDFGGANPDPVSY